MIQIKKSCALGFNIEVIVILAFSLYYLLPSISIRYGIQYPLLGEFLYLALVLIRHRGKLSKSIIEYIIIIAIIALLYLLLTDTRSIGTEVSNRNLKRYMSKFYQISMMFLPVLFLQRSLKQGSAKEQKILLAVSYLLVGYVVMNTIEAVLVDPYITRSTARHVEASLKNVANYDFVYAVPFTAALCAMLARGTKRVWQKAVLIVLLAIQLYFLMLTQYTLAIIACIVGVLETEWEAIRRARTRVILFSVVLMLLPLLPWAIKLAAEYVPSEDISIRLTEIYNFLSRGDSTGYNFNGRISLYLQTIKAFLCSPIWGNRKLDFDGHATFLTVLSDLGLLGGVPYYYLYFSSKRRVETLLSARSRQFGPYFLMLMFIGFTNPIHAVLPLMFVCWFVVPLTLHFAQELAPESVPTITSTEVARSEL